MPIESSSVDLVVSVSKAPELVGEQSIEEFSRVLKPGGAIVIQASAEQTGSKVRIILNDWKCASFWMLKPLQEDLCCCSCCSQARCLNASC